MITAARDSREKQPACGDGCLHGSGSEQADELAQEKTKSGAVVLIYDSLTFLYFGHTIRIFHLRSLHIVQKIYQALPNVIGILHFHRIHIFRSDRRIAPGFMPDQAEDDQIHRDDKENEERGRLLCATHAAGIVDAVEGNS